MKITFLGTGTSQGVPVIGGDASGIDLDNPKNWRTRSSVHVECGGIHIQIDAGPEFRVQCLKNKIDWIDCFILTHGHADCRTPRLLLTQTIKGWNAYARFFHTL